MNPSISRQHDVPLNPPSAVRATGVAHCELLASST